MYENATRSYQQTSFFTANPLKLVLMCYEVMIASLKLARDSYAAGEFETKGRALKKTTDIIYELNASLDLEKGGECAANLRNLYAYMTQALTEADLKKEIGTFTRIIQMMEELESAWKTAATRVAGVEESMPGPVIRREARPAAVARVWSV